MNRSAGLMLLHHGGSLLSVCEEHQPALYNARSIAACTLYTLLRNPCRHADLHWGGMWTCKLSYISRTGTGGTYRFRAYCLYPAINQAALKKFACLHAVFPLLRLHSSDRAILHDRKL